MTTPEPDRERDRRLLLCIFYKGPWDYLSEFFWGVKKDNTLRWEIPLRPKGWRRVLAALGDWANRRDTAWRNKYAERNENPPDRWKRRRP